MTSKAITAGPHTGTPQTPELATQKLDQLADAALAPLTGGLSPVSLALALADWAWHLCLSPGRQLELTALAVRLGRDALTVSGEAGNKVGDADDDPRFRHDAWAIWPFSQLRHGFHTAEVFWRDAAQTPGMTAHHANMTQFFARQWLGMLTPANWLVSNPVVLQDVMETNGAHLLKGAQNWLADVSGLKADTSQTAGFVVGRDVATTPGKVVFRNHLIELIRFDAQTETVHPEPVLIVPSWIMKYYILDLSAHNSMVRYLVGQGHCVYMLSWRNPDASDRNLSMDDYLRQGVLAAMRAIGEHNPQAATHGLHATGYCLGGTLLAIAAAALARSSGIAGASGLPALKSLTLLAAQTDFSEPGELGLFIDESQLRFLDNMTHDQGYLSGKQMAGSFQFLHSRDLVWTRRMREYLMGEREQQTDLMAWNADTTRMPACMYREYLTSLYLNNALATSTYPVDDRTVSLADIRIPVFMVGTQRDHISPWTSVYKLHRLCETEITFVLTLGGHNAGIVSEPGHPNRSYQMDVRAAHGRWVEPAQWAAQAPRHGGSWWPAWHRWLARRSGRKQAATQPPRATVVCDAPGTYVMQRYTD